MLCSQYSTDNQRNKCIIFENTPQYIKRISHNIYCELRLKLSC